MNCSGINCKFENATREHLMHHIRNDIPTKIRFDQLDLFPTRRDFTDPKLRPAFEQQIKSNKPILFIPTSIVEKNDYVGGVGKYKVYLFGVIPCGSKVCVILDNVEVNIDILVPKDKDTKQFTEYLRGKLIERNIPFIGIHTVKQFQPHGFQKEPSDYKRILFNNLQDRRKFIDLINDLNEEIKNSATNNTAKLETAANDSGRANSNFYFSKVAREYRFSTADWNRISEYTVAPKSTTLNCEYTLRVDVKNFQKVRNRNELLKGPLAKVLDRDPTMVCMWDIETHRTIQNGLVPTTVDNDWTIFMMCSSYFHQWSNTPLVHVCVVDVETNARPGIGIIIECGNERNVCIAHMKIMGKMSPEISGAFNGGNFDWPLYREKLKRYNLLVQLKSNLSSLAGSTSASYADTDDKVYRWNFLDENIKIDSETTHKLSCVANFPGLLDVDVLPVFLKLYPRAEVRKSASLNFFLAKNKLESKEDMPYKKMFRIYERALKLANMKSCHCGSAQDLCSCCKEHVREIDYKPTNDDFEYSTEFHDDLLHNGKLKCCFCGKKPRNLRDMGDVGFYCDIDCLRPQQLFVKRSIVSDKRELSNMSYVSLYDSFYRADGMKVCNLVGTYCTKWQIAFSNISNGKSDSEKDHYPGAWVFPPNRGLHSDGWIEIDVRDPNGNITKRRMRCRPITGLDFASLYPSLMMAYNLSIDTVITDREIADQLIKEGYTLHHVGPFTIERGAKKKAAINKKIEIEGWTVRHNGIFHPKKDKQTIEKYTKYITHKYDGGAIKYIAETGPSEEQLIKLDQLDIEGKKYSRDVTYEPTYGRAPLPGERMGIMSFVVKKLFDKRVPIKAEFVRLSKLKEKMIKEGVESTKHLVDGKEVDITLSDVDFNINKIDSKQKALKTLANTFYGKAGDFRAPIYSVIVSGGVTTAGQMNIKAVANLVRSKGFIEHYGDTDSLYLSCPDSVYKECDEVYDSEMAQLRAKFEGVPEDPCPHPDDLRAVEFKKRRIDLRVKWWERQVEITMNVMNALKEDVSDFLLADNGTRFLNMAYEEVGFPTFFCGKKKYYMIPHITTINFHNDELFVRGIEVIKQGHAMISKQLGEEFMMETMSPENEREPIDIACDKIRKFYASDINPKMFSQSAKYRPDKKNVAVQTFVARMREMQKKYAHDPIMSALYEPPEAGDKFEYVVVKKETNYTLSGCKIKMKKGDQMEFTRVFRASQNTNDPMQIDLNHYMKSAIVGIFARFIAYHPKFQPPQGKYDVNDKDEYKAMDKFCIDAATKYLEELCDQITGSNKNHQKLIGQKYRKVYNKATKLVRSDLHAKYGCAADIINQYAPPEDNDVAESTLIIKSIEQRAFEGFEPKSDIVISNLKQKMSLFTINSIYCNKTNGIFAIRQKLCDARRKKIIEQLYQITNRVARIAAQHTERFVLLIEDLRRKTDEEIDEHELEYVNSFNDEEVELLKRFKKLSDDLISVKRVELMCTSLNNMIMIEKALIIDDFLEPAMNPRQRAQIESKNAPLIENYEFQ